MFFKQRSAKLYNGDKVRAGDKVSFVNSDGKKNVGTIEYDINEPRRLFFWNNLFDVKDYRNAKKEQND